MYNIYDLVKLQFRDVKVVGENHVQNRILYHNTSEMRNGRIYRARVRSDLVYERETWVMRMADHDSNMEISEKRMFRWMCGVSLRET